MLWESKKDDGKRPENTKAQSSRKDTGFKLFKNKVNNRLQLVWQTPGRTLQNKEKQKPGETPGRHSNRQATEFNQSSLFARSRKTSSALRQKAAGGYSKEKSLKLND